MSDQYFYKAQEKIIVECDRVSQWAVRIAREIYDEAQALKPESEKDKRIKELEAAIREHKYQCDGHTYPADYDHALYAVLDNKEEG
jgi:hypothetical protein